MPGLIEDYALLGDLQTAALVGRDGSIDWLCLPRFDSSACFAALLGDESHGRWLLAPAADGSASRRRYRADTLVLETEWTTPDGTVRVVDCMPPRGEAADVVRLVEGISGTVPMRMELTLRFDYGRVVPWVRRQGRDLAAIAGPDAVWLRTEAPVHGRGRATVSEFAVQAGQRVPFVLTYERSYRPRPRPVEAEQAVAETVQFWREWIGRCDYEGGWAGAVRRALLTLKALTYAPTGGILAAATTSLPEQLGGTAELGLPVLLAARRHVHPAGAAGHRIRRGGQGVAGVAAAGRRRRSRRLADHVRPGRHPADSRVHLGLADRLPGCSPGPDRQRRRRPIAA